MTNSRKILRGLMLAAAVGLMATAAEAKGKPGGGGGGGGGTVVYPKGATYDTTTNWYWMQSDVYPVWHGTSANSDGLSFTGVGSTITVIDEYSTGSLGYGNLTGTSMAT